VYHDYGGKVLVYSSIECIAKVMLLARYSEDTPMALLSAAYFDASGKQEGYPFLTVVGAASPIKKWIRFENQWSKALRNEGVSEFHATDFSASLGEYREWKGDKVRRSAFLKQLLKIIEHNVNKLFLATIEMRVWREVNREYCVEEFFHSPYALAGFTVTSQAIRWAGHKKVPLPFKIVFEDGDEGWGGLTQLCKKYNHFEPIRLPKKEVVPFQLGDFFAWKTRITATNAMNIVDRLQRDSNLDGILDEIKSLDNILVRPAHNGIYTQRGLEKTCQIYRVPKRSDGT
jgi:hypothetical protein